MEIMNVPTSGREARDPRRGALAALIVLLLASLPALGALAFTVHIVRERELLVWWMLPAPAWLALAVPVGIGLVGVVRRRVVSLERARTWVGLAIALSVSSFALTAWIVHALMNLNIYEM